MEVPARPKDVVLFSSFGSIVSLFILMYFFIQLLGAIFFLKGIKALVEGTFNIFYIKIIPLNFRF
jgi:hypothetical protein